MWVYRRVITKRDENDDGVIWTFQIGYYLPDGSFYVAENASEKEARRAVHYLNGGN